MRRSATERIVDGLWRVIYRVGFRAARQWWRLRRPRHDGAVVAVWAGEHILAVQQSYRRNLSFPGGGIHPGEEAQNAARRELREELGITVDGDELHPAREMVVEWDFRRDHVRIFELRLPTAPDLRIDNREIVAAHWMTPEALLATGNLPPFVRAYLEEVVA
jgi:8-oxo-dGTP diphosphatase